MGDRLSSRRRVLVLGGIATVTSLAGCSDVFDGGDGEDGGNGNGSAGPNEPESGPTDGDGNGNAGPDETEFDPADCEPETVSGDIQTDTTWSAQECPRVELDGNVRVLNDATLTIQAGVEVVGLPGSRITVLRGGSLEALGDPDDPVWFYGETDTRGFWEGLRFKDETTSELDNVVLRNGGADDWANIYVDGQAELSVTNTLSEQCSTAGLVAEGGTTFREFSNNAFRGDEFAAVQVPTSHLGMLDSGSTYAGNNGFDAVYVTSNDVGSEGTWPGIPYRFESANHRIQAAVTVDPGASFVFEQEGRITVRRDGSFAVEGTNDDPVTFEGDNATPGYWEGIRLRTNNPNNSLTHVEIAHAGANDWANIYLDDQAELSITNTLSEQSSTAGLVAEGGTTLAEFSKNEFRGNEFAAVLAPTSHIAMLDSGSSYVGDNGFDAVYVTSNDVGSEGTWPAAPYRLEGGNHRIQAAVTVDPGASFVVEEEGRITVRREGGLTAEGESDATIIFEGARAERGVWEGIRFRTNTPENSLDHVVVADGGANNWANVYLDGNSQATVTNSTFRRSATYGIVAEGGTTLDASSNTYENNAEGAIRNENN